MVSAFKGINATRAAVSQALRSTGGDWCAALPGLSSHLRAGWKSHGWSFIAETAQDVEVFVSPTLRALTMRALEGSADPRAALRLVRRLVDPSDSPDLAARVWKESRGHLAMALIRAIWAEDRARRRRRTDPRQLTFDFVRK